MFTNPLPDTKAVADRLDEIGEDVIVSGFDDRIALEADLRDHPDRLRTQTQQFELHIEKSGWVHIYPAGSLLGHDQPIATVDISQIHDPAVRAAALDHVDHRHRWVRFGEVHSFSSEMTPMADSDIADELSDVVAGPYQFHPYHE